MTQEITLVRSESVASGSLSWGVVFLLGGAYLLVDRDASLLGWALPDVVRIACALGALLISLVFLKWVIQQRGKPPAALWSSGNGLHFNLRPMDSFSVSWDDVVGVGRLNDGDVRILVRRYWRERPVDVRPKDVAGDLSDAYGALLRRCRQAGISEYQPET